MPKLYIDTNKFLGLYRTGKDSLAIFEDLTKHSDYLVTTSQTVNEFHRNRVSVLNWLIGEFNKSIEIKGPLGSSILKALDPYKVLKEKIENCGAEIKKHQAEVKKSLEELIEDETKDPIAVNFCALCRSKNISKYDITDELIGLAKKRKLLGNPPTSVKKYSIGDELIWEALIKNLKDDLIILTEDHTFTDNFFLLKQEFKSKTGKELLPIRQNFREAIEALGFVPSRKLVEVEKAIEEEKKEAYNVLLECPYCHAYNKRIGARCMECGRVSRPQSRFLGTGSFLR